MIRSIAILLLTAAMSGCSAGPRPSDVRATAVFTAIQTAVGEDSPIPCTILLPGRGQAPPPGGYPAIVFLHGRGECGRDGVRSLAVGLPAAALADPARWPMVIVVPQKPEQQDTWEQHAEAVLACLERACAEAPIDRTRVYLTGLSQGGAGTWAIGARFNQRFAAIAPVCGFVHDPTGPLAGAVRVGDAARRTQIAAALAASGTPIWAFHGERDDVVLPEQTRQLVTAVEAAGGTARATYLPEANHNAWDPAYRDHGADLAQWFLGHRRR